MADIEKLVREYFQNGLQIKDIRAVIGEHHGIWRSCRQIKRILKRLSLSRKRESPIESIIDAVQIEILNSSKSFGIRMMHRVLLTKYNLAVKRMTVRDVMEAVQPGRMKRALKGKLHRRIYKNGGPNHVIHIDGYDKLTPFGFCIHGAIDGWSRAVLWLEVGETNKKPQVIANYFLDYVKKINGIPLTIRMDNGTENCLVADIQALLRETSASPNNAPPYIYGKSVRNQRIEKFWQYCHSHFAEFWKHLFKDLEMTGLYDSVDYMKKSLLQFCFTPILAQDLAHIKRMWNIHRVRKMKNVECPSGVPEVLYMIPEYYGGTEKKSPVDMNVLDCCASDMCAKKSIYGCDDEMAEIFLECMITLNLSLPTSWTESLELYASLYTFLT